MTKIETCAIYFSKVICGIVQCQQNTDIDMQRLSMDTQLMINHTAILHDRCVLLLEKWNRYFGVTVGEHFRLSTSSKTIKFQLNGF